MSLPVTSSQASSASSPQSGPSSPTAKHLLDSGIALLIGLGVLLVVLALGAPVGVPMNDDFSYAHTARALAETGHIRYNGWGSPLMLPQAWVGAIVIRVWGWGYVPLDWVGMVSGALSAALLFLLARRCGCSRLVSAVVTGLLTLNPIFLCVMPTFLTELPSLFLFLSALLCLGYAIRSDSRGVDETSGTTLSVSSSFLALSALFAILAGANRQILWLAMLGAYIGLGFLLPPQIRWRKILLVCLTLLAAVIVGTVWSSNQPYLLSPSYSESFRHSANDPVIALVNLWRPFIHLGLFLSPIVFPLVFLRRAKTNQTVTCIAGTVLGGGFALFLLWSRTRGYLRFKPFHMGGGGDYLTEVGTYVGGINALDARPQVFGFPVAMFLYFLGTIALVLGISLIATFFRSLRGRRYFLPVESAAAITALSALPFQVVPALPWYAEGNGVDRYLLLMLPCLYPILGLIWSISTTQETVQAPKRTVESGVGGVTLLVCGLVLVALTGIVFTQEYLSQTNARAMIFRNLTGQGISPRQIDSGVELAGDTQLSIEDHINHAWLGSADRGFDKQRSGNNSIFPQYFPVIQAKYLVTLSPNPELPVTSPHYLSTEVIKPPVATYEYRSLLPPRKRKVYVFGLRRGNLSSGTP